MHRHIIYRDYCCYEQSPAKPCWKSPANLSRRPAPRAERQVGGGPRLPSSRAGRGGGGPGGHPLLLGTLPCSLCAGTGPSLPPFPRGTDTPTPIPSGRPGRAGAAHPGGRAAWGRGTGFRGACRRRRGAGPGLRSRSGPDPHPPSPGARLLRPRPLHLEGPGGGAGRGGWRGARAAPEPEPDRTGRRGGGRRESGGRPGRGAAGMERPESVEAWLDDHRDFAFSYFVRKASR